ncbi:MAG: universal stress protein [Bacteriovoracaceae bacterium]|nr:universal stress protein [Bacteriovoracaceae bacterium]
MKRLQNRKRYVYTTPSRYRYAKDFELTPDSLMEIYEDDIIEKFVTFFNEQTRNDGINSHVISVQKGKKLRLSVSDYLNTKDADLVILGTHSKKGIERMFLGSVAEWIIRSVNTSILVTKMA